MSPAAALAAVAALPAAVALAGPAAARVPYMDAGTTCGPKAEETGDRLATQVCLYDEAFALSRLAPAWGALPPSVRAHCLAAERRAGAGSYRSLAACVERRLAGAGLAPLALHAPTP